VAIDVVTSSGKEFNLRAGLKPWRVKKTKLKLTLG
jgi:hypothetical protein